MLMQPPIPPEAVRDSIARLLLQREYRESMSNTLLSRLWDWFARTVGDLFVQASQSRGTYLISLTLIAAAIALGIARAVVVARARRLAASRREVPETADEQLAQARGLAAQGAFVEASHRLYSAIVTRLVEQKRVRRHPSKTVGDYGRELRASGDHLTAPYLTFAQLYDVVVYGDGLCDAVRFARLETLAEPLVQARDSVDIPQAA